MRAPVKPFNLLNTLNEEAEHWPNGYGALVHNGRKQLFHLGQRLGHHYRNLLEPRNVNVTRDFQVVTTPVHRCYESAQHLLAGFFSLSSDWTWMEAVEKQPIPILYQSPDKASIIGNKKACPKYNKLLETNLPDPDSPEIEYFRHFVMNHTSHLNMTTLNDVFMFADYIKILEFMNLEHPKWLTADFKEKLYAFFDESFHFLSRSTEMIRLLSGPLIEDITVRFKEAIYAEPTNSKMFLYSGHDVSVHGLSKLLGFHLDFAPYFGSSLIFEVHKLSSTDHRIRILFSKDYSFDNVEVWRLPECEEFCPVGKFLQIVEKFFAKNWTSECLV
ncbi:hypothetical protein V9T40_003178 [Parthenolecanium corni]|uniref:Acid phosphatase n=1 Tax=Parthenolecanium corni TaxID=536013 RepID=A0AAN9U0T4_9HEMI